MPLAAFQRQQCMFITYCCLVQVLPVNKVEACLWWQTAFKCVCPQCWSSPSPVTLHCLQVPRGRRGINPQKANPSVGKTCSASPENTIWNMVYFECLTNRPRLSKGPLKTVVKTISYAVQNPTTPQNWSQIPIILILSKEHRGLILGICTGKNLRQHRAAVLSSWRHHWHSTPDKSLNLSLPHLFSPFKAACLFHMEGVRLH